MESLKKIITLNQAAKLSGYTQDYLGYLIRKGEIKGKKVGKSWFTTEEEVRNYIFKKSIRHEKLAIRGFFSRRRRKNILIATIIIFTVFFSALFYVYDFSNKNDGINSSPNKTLTTEVEASEYYIQ